MARFGINWKLPEGWQVKQLREVTEVIMGQSPRGESYSMNGDGYPLVGGATDLGELYPNPQKWTSAPTKLSVEGDIILCVRATIGNLNWADGVYCLGRGVAAIRQKSAEAERGWIYYWLMASADGLNAIGTGSTFKQISKHQIESFEIPLPPLAEQARIVAKLERIERARRAQKQAIEQTKALLKAALAQVFDTKEGLPEGWEWATVASLLDDCRAGIWGTEPRDEQGVPVIRSTDMRGGCLSFEGVAVRDVPSDKIEKYTLQDGDILVSRSSGSRHLVGMAVYYEPPPDGGIYLFSNFVQRLRPNREKTLPKFLYHYLVSPYERAFLDRMQTTTSGLRNLNIKGYLAQPIPLPPLHTQQHIAAKLDRIQRALKLQREALQKIDALMQSALHRAFRGEL